MSFSYMMYDKHVNHDSNGFQTSGKQIRIYINIYSPEHIIMSAYKHLTFQFVLLELATHLI